MIFSRSLCFRLARRDAHAEATGSQRKAKASVHGRGLVSLGEAECESLHQAGEHQEELHLRQLFSHAHSPTCGHRDDVSPYTGDKTPMGMVFGCVCCCSSPSFFQISHQGSIKSIHSSIHPAIHPLLVYIPSYLLNLGNKMECSFCIWNVPHRSSDIPDYGFS